MNNATIRRIRNIAVAAAFAVGAVAAAGSAQARPADVTARVSHSAAEWSGVIGPNSTNPGPGWFYWTTYENHTQCLFDGFRRVALGLAKGVVCPARFDGLGYDQWLTY
ncbi:hypothetical protein [Actinoplanes flavus]|uniref:Secreted protein n=1 Tax=Actinoplanes flavus TaxID=2820290 RepID=A0ABS3UUK9_9ACTN|nr:hypothetical protein [Actinoplanes flavus]MBO3742251.1 hypothetical protein [Actinoplanes flavus]